MIRKGVVQHDARLLTRVLRQLTAVRAKLTPPVLRALTNQYMPSLTDAIVQAQVRHKELSDSRGLSCRATFAAMGFDTLRATRESAVC